MKEVLKLMGKVAQSNIKDIPLPYKLNFCCTFKCQSRCKTCSIWKLNPKGELTTEEIRTFFKKNNFFSWIDISGGEIFLRDDIDEVFRIILEECKDLYLFHFPTNGLMPSRIIDSTKKLMKLKPKRVIVTVSLDGPRNLNDDLRGVPGGFDKALQTYRGLKAVHGVEVFFGVTFSKYNIDMFTRLVEEVKQHIPDIKVADFHINVVHESDNYLHNRGVVLDKTANKSILRNVKEYMKMKGPPLSALALVEWHYLKNMEKYFETNKMPYKCRALSASCYLDPSGNIFPCTMYARKLGNIRDYHYDLRKLFASQDIKQIRKDIHKNRCPGCWTACEAYQVLFGSMLRVATWF